MNGLREALKRHMQKRTDFFLEPFLDVNGEETGFGRTEVDIMIQIIEDSGHYDVVPRRW